MRKSVREIYKLAAAEGHPVRRVEHTGSSHIKFWFEGLPDFIVVSNSPTCRGVNHNTRSILRRMIKELK